MRRQANAPSTRSMEELIALATHLAEADDRMRAALIRARKDAGLTQRDVADQLGIKQSSIAAFERLDNDPRLSTIRRYALAVGAQIDHRVACSAWANDWTPVAAEGAIDFVWQGTSDQITFRAPADAQRTDFALSA